MDVFFGNNNYYNLHRDNGLLYITLQAIYPGSPTTGVDIEFILDTGAYMTVISRGTAIRCGFDKLPKKSSLLFGFGDAIGVDIVRIPSLVILEKTRTDVPVLIPHNMYRTNPKTGEKRQMPEVLGLNVLEYYNYYIDTEHDKLYLNENPRPRFYSPSLASGQAFMLPSE
jgi:hypothetical protein